MKRVGFILSASVVAAVLSVATATAQVSYDAPLRSKIEWLPQHPGGQRYTIGLNLVPLINRGAGLDFEYELSGRGNWIETTLTGYLAPARADWNGSDRHNDRDGNDRFMPRSSFGYFHSMWGVGVSALYKKIYTRGGWYFSAGLSMEYFRVGVLERMYFPFERDGVTFYAKEYREQTRSYLKPSLLFNLGKHIALSGRCFLDLSIGMTAGYSIYDRREGERDFRGMYGFGYRGVNLVDGGFRFGVLIGGGDGGGNR